MCLKMKKDPVVANLYGNVEPHRDCIHVWHKKLAHASYKTVMKTIDNALPVKITKCSQYIRCVLCLEGKSKNSPVRKTSNVTVSKILELVSVDLIGPMPKPSFGGAKYILSIQDQYSRFGFCYVLRDKTETAS